MTPTLPLAMQLADELRGCASVQIDNLAGGISVTVTPANPAARSFGWADFSGQVYLQVGERGGRWELEAHPADLAHLADIARSVVAGRVEEVFALRRSSVSVTLADGTVEKETGYDGLPGCLPLPLWRRWGRRAQYSPYR